MGKTVLDVLIDRLNESIKSHHTALVSGRAKDFAEYRELVGAHRALTSVQVMVEGLTKEAMYDE